MTQLPRPKVSADRRNYRRLWSPETGGRDDCPFQPRPFADRPARLERIGREARSGAGTAAGVAFQLPHRRAVRLKQGIVVWRVKEGSVAAHTQRMTVSVWATPVETLYQELMLPKPDPASVVAAAVTARMGIALLIKTLAVVGNRKSFDGDRDKLKTVTEAAQRESEKLAKAADDDVTGAPERRLSEVPMTAAAGATRPFRARLTLGCAMFRNLTMSFSLRVANPPGS